MPVNASVEVYGVKQALKELGQVDKKQRFKAVSKVKAAGGEMVGVARSTYPANPALPNWPSDTNLGYNKSKVDKGVQIQVGGRSRGNSYAIVTIIQKDRAGAMFDIAGFANGSYSQGPQGDAFIEKLNREYGKAQRGMFRKVREIQSVSTEAILKALEEVVAETNRKLVR